MSKLDNLVNELSQITMLEAAELAKRLEQAWGVSARSTAPNPIVTEKVSAVEPTSWNVKLLSFGDKKVEVVKTVRQHIGLGLRESMAKVEEAPVVIKDGLNKEQALAMQKSLEDVGAKVEIIGVVE